MKRKGSPPPLGVDRSPKRACKGKENGEFCSGKASIVLSVPPIFVIRLHYSVEEMFRYYDYEVRAHSSSHTSSFFSHSRRYEPTPKRVVLGHSVVHFIWTSRTCDPLLSRSRFTPPGPGSSYIAQNSTCLYLSTTFRRIGGNLNMAQQKTTLNWQRR
jgi:hypothetical protein